MKYLIVRDENCKTEAGGGEERAIVFDVKLVHKQIGSVHCAGALTVVSAGFCKIKGCNVIAGGRSESLGINSRPHDAVVIAESLGLAVDDV